MKLPKIEISRDFKSLGYFDAKDVVESFQKGKLSNGDYGRYEDSSEWRPVGIVVETMPKTSLTVKSKAKKETAPSRVAKATTTKSSKSGTKQEKAESKKKSGTAGTRVRKPRAK